MKKTTVTAILLAAFVGSTALATMELQKEYKAKNPAAKCSTCHTAAMPKKGAADLNDFGKSVVAAKDKDGKVDWSKVEEKK